MRAGFPAPGRIAAGLALAAALTCAAAPVRAASLQAGFTALGNGDYAAAEAAFLEVLAETPRQPQAMRLLGQAYLEEGRLQEAYAVLQILRVLTPDDPNVHFTLARVYYEAGLPQDERRALLATLRLAPDHAQAHRFLGHNLVLGGELYGASAEYVWLLEDAEGTGSPVDPVVLFNLGALDARLGRPERARELLSRFLAAVPEGEQADRARALLAPLAAAAP